MHVMSDTRCNHVARDESAPAKARIVAAGHDICQARLDGRLDGNLGISLQKARQHGPKYEPSDWRRHGQTKVARRLISKRVDRLDRGIESIEQRPELNQETLAGISWSDAARRAI
jgi:hypothetical protein